MRYQRLFADEQGESHWETVEVALSEQTFAPPAKSILVSESEPVRSLLHLRLKSGWNEPVHPTPKAQTLICLKGRVKVTASDGETRVIGPCDIWRMEDKFGKGHHTEVISDEDFDAMIVQFD